MGTNRCHCTVLYSTQASVTLFEISLIVTICGTVFQTLALANSSVGLQYDLGFGIVLSADNVPNPSREETAEMKPQCAPSRARTRLPFFKTAGQWDNGRKWPERTKPFVIMDGHRKSLHEALQNSHPEKLQCGLPIQGNVYVLDLEKNGDLLPSPPAVFYYPPNGTGVARDETPVRHCYYHGSVRGFPQSRLALSVCSGLRGVIVINASLSFELKPEEEENQEEEGEGGSDVHLLYPTHQLGSWTGNCGVSHHPLPPLDVWPQTHRRKRDILTETKYIELVLVVDYKEYLNYQKNNKTIIYRMLDVANQIDLFYRPLNVRVALLGLEIWSDGNRIQVDGSPAATLDRFLEWRYRELLPRLRHDNAQLVLGEAFNGRTVGMASQSSMCSPDTSGGINVDTLVSVLGVASTVAHELGHNLGMFHDLANRQCLCEISTQQGGCIMEPSTGLLPGQMFSSCSARDLAVALLHGGGKCLFNVPRPERLLGAPRCGNLYVEKGEECDCGLAHECKDPCCNATSCTLVPGAQCSSDGICCDNCKLRSAGWVCRDRLGECDLPEHCTGTSPHCPPNVFLQDGQPCKGGQAYCSSGVCSSLDSQCQMLWGPNSTQAPGVCFSSVNKLGNKYGNCGRMPNGTYIPCLDVDVYCGKIQCQGGNSRPLLGARAQILRTTVRRNQSEFVCRATYFDLGDDVSDPAVVAQATACGPGKACVGQRCRDVSLFGVEECQRKCNGHGVCNSNNNCHCDMGWAPPDCKHPGNGGSVDSGPILAPTDVVRVALLVIVLFILPLVLLLMVAGFLHCRRRLFYLSSSPFLKAHSQQKNWTRAIEEGDARNGDQVQPLSCPAHHKRDIVLAPSTGKAEDRPLPPNKPLPPDPVSKRVQSVGERPHPPTKPLPPDPIPKTDKTTLHRPARPNRPLSPDQVLADGQTCVPARPAPPKRHLPAAPHCARFLKSRCSMGLVCPPFPLPVQESPSSQPGLVFLLLLLLLQK
ncbi:hypothetical protein MATL_G00232350 [Megalops atlanticus]|uniref:Disintegrin and metalloproteinase domain-containing protein 15 n=1 Tax=Megalops atlanticus TaxID=7932 RepID=A0A9D3PE14_MEGAT|nr:hypothetical protein MATL_G00232350 [Megalops atlanticus]